MAATTVDRNTVAKYIQRTLRIPLAASTTIPAGAIVCTNASGLAVNGADTAGLICQGRAEHRASTVDGDTEVVVGRGGFWYANDGTIVQADVGTVATILDNQTVSKAATTANDIPAGHIDEVDATLGVLIDMLGGKIAAT